MSAVRMRLAVATGLVLAVSACSSTTANSDSSSDAPAAASSAAASSAPAETAEASAEPSVEAEALTFGFVQILDDPFFTAAYEGAVEAAAKLGVTVNLTGPHTNDTARQVSDTQSLVVQGVDGIILSPGDATALGVPVKAAKDAGIPTVLYNSTLEDNTLAISTVVSDNYAGAVAGGQYMCEQLGGTGQVAIIMAVEGIPVLNQRWDGFKEGLAKNCPNVEVVAEELTGNDIGKGTAIVAALFTKYPDLKGIYADDGNNSTAVSQGMKQAHIDPKSVVAVAFDFSSAQADLLLAGELDALIAQKPKAMGAQSVELLVKSINGETVPKDVNVGFELVTPENFEANKQWMY